MKNRKWLQKTLSSTRIRIFVLFVIFNVFSLFISDVIIYHSSADVLFRQACNIMENNLHSVSYSLDSALDMVNAALSDSALDKEVVADIQTKHPGGSYAYLLVNDRMKELLNKILNTSRLLQSVYLVSDDFEYFCKSEINRTYRRNELMQTAWSQMLHQTEDNAWYVISGQNNIVEKREDNTLTMVKRIYNSRFDRVVGYISANIGFQELENYLSQFKFGQTGYLVVCDSDGHVVYHPDASLGGQRYDRFEEIEKSRDTFTRENTLVTYQVSETSGLVYIAHTPLSEVIVPVATIQKTVLFLFVASILLSLCYAGVIAGRIYAPIKVLITHMKKAAGGDTSVRIREIRHDEMGSLYENFNYMISRIERLIQKLYEQEVMTKELRIKNLQIQLNPHFLYNVLDSIHWAARENDMDDVCKMTFLLSRYFQKNLDNGRDWSAVSDIASAMKSYMELQKIRYGEKLMYEIDVDPDIADCLVPKYLFQPLLENAILHGIEKRSSTGICHVAWTKEGDKIHFCVEDNGTGIEAERLEEIRAAIERNDMNMAEHFAFRNINAQLHMLYGSEYHLMIDSTPGEGTRVEFYMPLQKEGNHVSRCDY